MRKIEPEVKYQIWSSVLNNTLTDVQASNGIASTKVFAGGAVIAHQGRSSFTAHQVSWTHADPVTGSSQTVTKTGESSDSSRIELEPLGQEVQPLPPPEEPNQTGGSNYSASAPEWLCRFASKDYWEMPTSCQQAYLTRNDVQLQDLLSSETENNPKKIAESPNRQKPTLKQGERLSQEELSRRRALAATGKFDNEADDADLDGGVPDFLDAEFQGLQTQVKYKNKNSAIKDAIKDADSILSGNNDCSKFFGKYWQKGLIELDKLLQKGSIDRDNTLTGIRIVLENGNDVLGAVIETSDKAQTQEKAYRIFKEGTVNSNGPFFNKFSKAKIGKSQATGFQGYESGSKESRVAQILHELAHMIYKSNGKGGYEPLIPNDLGSGLEGQSEINTDTILANCKSEIDKLNSGKKK